MISDNLNVYSIIFASEKKNFGLDNSFGKLESKFRGSPFLATLFVEVRLQKETFKSRFTYCTDDTLCIFPFTV